MSIPISNGKLGAHRVHGYVEKWENGRTPADGAPDSVEERVHWHDPVTGEEITDPDRIADLNARHKALHPGIR